jgi:hypothetical protein
MIQANDKAVRYSTALCHSDKKVDGSHFFEGNTVDHKSGLLKSEFDKLKASAPVGFVWICTGWSNPSSPEGWIDA